MYLYTIYHNIYPYVLYIYIYASKYVCVSVLASVCVCVCVEKDEKNACMVLVIFEKIFFFFLAVYCNGNAPMAIASVTRNNPRFVGVPNTPRVRILSTCVRVAVSAFTGVRPVLSFAPS